MSSTFPTPPDPCLLLPLSRRLSAEYERAADREKLERQVVEVEGRIKARNMSVEILQKWVKMLERKLEAGACGIYTDNEDWERLQLMREALNLETQLTSGSCGIYSHRLEWKRLQCIKGRIWAMTRCDSNAFAL